MQIKEKAAFALQDNEFLSSMLQVQPQRQTKVDQAGKDLSTSSAARPGLYYRSSVLQHASAAIVWGLQDHALAQKAICHANRIHPCVV